jgi:uncharacterized protein
MTSTAQRASGSAARTLGRRLADRALARVWRLPAPNDYTVERGIRVPMRDGVDLVADHYIPATTPAGTLLVRGPYGRRFPFSIVYARLYAARGYHVILQSVRGTFGSGGVFEPMVNEAADGADTVAWLRQQPWFTGRFATIGLSYLGFTQWALLTDPPPELATAIITVAPHDFSQSTWGTGSFTLNDFLGWCDLVAHQEDGSMLRMALQQALARRRLARAVAGVPVGEAGRALLGTGAPWYEGWLEHSDCTDPFWQPYQLGTALDRVQVPLLLVGGWQDLFIRQTLEQYRHLRGRGIDVALTVGPWTHRELIGNATGTIVRESLDWLGTQLGGGPSARRSPVRVFVTGDGWVDLPGWPPATSERVLYLQPAGGLTDTEPPADASPTSFLYNPYDPTPTVGGRLLDVRGGYRNDSRLARRSDVLPFTSDVLAEDLSVCGTPVVDLSHSSANPHVDVFVRVSEVDARGRSRNVSDGFRRLPPDTRARLVRIELDPIAHRFRAGSRIRVYIAGGCHPRFARNPGSGEPTITARRLIGAVHVVHHGEGGVSRLVLPVSAGRPSADGG